MPVFLFPQKVKQKLIATMEINLIFSQNETPWAIRFKIKAVPISDIYNSGFVGTPTVQAADN